MVVVKETPPAKIMLLTLEHMSSYSQNYYITSVPGSIYPDPFPCRGVKKR